jgi:hypothetical protein
MKNDKSKKKKESAESASCCYSVVDACGCVVGWYCCDGPDMTQCRFENRC